MRTSEGRSALFQSPKIAPRILEIARRAAAKIGDLLRSMSCRFSLPWRVVYGLSWRSCYGLPWRVVHGLPWRVVYGLPWRGIYGLSPQATRMATWPHAIV